MCQDAPNPKIISLRNKIMVAFLVAVVLWGMVNSALLERALFLIITRERLPEEIIDKISRNFVTINTGLTLLGVLMFHIIGSFFSRTIALPIKKLNEGISRLATG